MLIVSIDWQWWRHHLSVFALCLVAYLINLVEKPYLSQAAKCICLELLNVIFSDCKIYLSQLISCICLKLQNVFVSNLKIYLYKIALCSFVKKQQKISNRKMYFSQIAKCICLKLAVNGAAGAKADCARPTILS